MQNKSTFSVMFSGHYLEINFNTFRRVTHFATQGGTDLNYVEKFFVLLKGETGLWKDYVEDGQLKVCTTIDSPWP